MIMKLYLDGLPKHVSAKLTMDKFDAVEIFSLVIAIVKGMFEFTDIGENNDELHFLSLWDIIPDDAFIHQRALHWRNLKASDAYCIHQCACEQRLLEETSNWLIWIPVFLVILCIICTCCFVLFATIISREEKKYVNDRLNNPKIIEIAK